MERAIRYSASAHAAIRQYLDGVADARDPMVAFAASIEIQREMRKIAVDPGLGSAPTGPFETRPIYAFYLEAGDAPRRAQVSYKASEEYLDVLLFSCVRV